jgi:hypothetical protein
MGSDVLAGLGIASVGVAVTVGAITGIIFLARYASRAGGVGEKLLAGVAILILLCFILVGLLATGCGAIAAGGH